MYGKQLSGNETKIDPRTALRMFTEEHITLKTKLQFTVVEFF